MRKGRIGKANVEQTTRKECNKMSEASEERRTEDAKNVNNEKRQGKTATSFNRQTEKKVRERMGKDS